MSSPNPHADGIYQQQEYVKIAFNTRLGTRHTAELTIPQLFELAGVLYELIAAYEEAQAWPYGEYKNRQGKLPVLRDA